MTELLSQQSLLHAELHSRARFPQPECLEGTRQNLTDEIKVWMQGGNTTYEAVWSYGPVGVGKTAIAQTMGQWAERNQLLGAAVFLSKSGNQNDPYRLFISIAYQLSMKLGQGIYGKNVGEQLFADRDILNKDLATQFRKLIVEPLTGVRLPQRLVVIIDGLDECLGEKEQCEILRLIGRTANSPQPIPLYWMICSRPEPHLRLTLLSAFNTRCWWREVPLDDHDINLYIHDGFRRIKEETYPYAINEGELWPSEDHIRRIVRAAAGLFIYASTIIKFIEDQSLASPKAQLEIVLEFIQRAPTPNPSRRVNPLKPLDNLYSQILAQVHESRLSTTLLLMGTCAFYLHLPILELANLLGLSQEQFYAALQRVHSVLGVPNPDKAPMSYLRFFHTSFVDFLRDSSRSGRFTLHPLDIHKRFGEACFRALGQTKVLFAKNLPWKMIKPNALTISHHVLSYAARQVWGACLNTGNEGESPLLDVIGGFDFSRLIFVKRTIPALALRRFATWLAKQVRAHAILDLVPF